MNNHKINIEWDSVVEEVIGTENPLGVTGIRLKNVKTDRTKELNVDGLFIAIGHHPNTDLFKGILNLDNEGYIITKPDSCETNIPGVFAAGDVVSGPKTVVEAVAHTKKVAEQMVKYCNEKTKGKALS
jgi:thioredoxin reductase (NADPH)